ncbi:hypothetical protein Dsin_028453 [Dipteronia sinensis]|uniref:RNase H type-1 domain-containing protein n=1 Tax=Dipteronia sinensis TaxID=43782 RepID=A0AAE0DVK2_9ROSI|nr:hypothetical protein Dsin_028453 [Dipteronia sinensis]
MASNAQRLEVSFSPQVAEVVTILRGIDLAMDTCLVPAIVESDALGVVNLINSGHSVSAEVGMVVDDIIHRIRTSTITLVGFVPRKTNFVAHYLAKIALTVSEDPF